MEGMYDGALSTARAGRQVDIICSNRWSNLDKLKKIHRISLTRVQSSQKFNSDTPEWKKVEYDRKEDRIENLRAGCGNRGRRERLEGWLGARALSRPTAVDGSPL